MLVLMRMVRKLWTSASRTVSGVPVGRPWAGRRWGGDEAVARVDLMAWGWQLGTGMRSSPILVAGGSDPDRFDPGELPAALPLAVRAGHGGR